MSEYKITADLFTVPNDLNKTILYAPFEKLIFTADDVMIKLLQNIEHINENELTPSEKSKIQYLISKNIINGTENDLRNLRNLEKIPVPDKLTLFPTNACSMACIYCYAAVHKSNKLSMSESIYTSAVRYYLNVMKEMSRSVFHLELHGGGEPFADFNLTRKIVNYAKDKCQEFNYSLEIFASTNGYLTKKQRQWIAQNFNSLLISFDVLPHIQNHHRPLHGSKSSFEEVDRTLKYFDEMDFPYGIRVTVTSYNLYLFKETIDFVHQNYKPKLVIFEPVDICGNCISDKKLKPDLNQFIQFYCEAEIIATQKNIQVEYSGATFERVNTNFCYVGTSQFAITPDGYLTNCWEVDNKNHSLSNVFIFGQINTDGTIKINEKKYAFLRSLSVHHIEYCKDCFAKWHCAGDCITRLGHNDYIKSRGGERCLTNRKLIANRLCKALNNFK